MAATRASEIGLGKQIYSQEGRGPTASFALFGKEEEIVRLLINQESKSKQKKSTAAWELTRRWPLALDLDFMDSAIVLSKRAERRFYF